jgi:hypothetical protein
MSRSLQGRVLRHGVASESEVQPSLMLVLGHRSLFCVLHCEVAQAGLELCSAACAQMLRPHACGIAGACVASAFAGMSAGR